MFKGIFLCVLFAVLCGNSVAEPEGFADEDINERDVRGLGSLLGKAFKFGLKTVGKMMGGAPREQRNANDDRRFANGPQGQDYTGWMDFGRRSVEDD